MLSIHRLVQVVPMDSIEPAEQRQWAERIIQAVNEVFPETVELAATSTWPLKRRYLP
jgi:hypothetical protein